MKRQEIKKGGNNSIQLHTKNMLFNLKCVYLFCKYMWVSCYESLMVRNCFSGNIFNKHMGKIDCFHIKWHFFHFKGDNLNKKGVMIIYIVVLLSLMLCYIN